MNEGHLLSFQNSSNRSLSKNVKWNIAPPSKNMLIMETYRLNHRELTTSYSKGSNCFYISALKDERNCSKELQMLQIGNKGRKYWKNAGSMQRERNRFDISETLIWIFGFGLKNDRSRVKRVLRSNVPDFAGKCSKHHQVQDSQVHSCECRILVCPGLFISVLVRLCSNMESSDSIKLQ